MKPPLVSVIIPCYNASVFIKETLESILGQSEREIEVVIVDDGSTDNSKEVISTCSDKRIIYTYQKNQGVSTARNKGLFFAKGEFIIFFDADDVMSNDFISERMKCLNENAEIDFVSGCVKEFNKDREIINHTKGISKNGITEILLYEKKITTCPSNYMFRRKFITQNNLLFNNVLSSTADKFFLIQAILKGNTKNIGESGELLYRVSESSMSHKLTKALVEDNERFYKQVRQMDEINGSLKRKSLIIQCFFLSAACFKTGLILKSIKYAVIGLCKGPVMFLKLIYTRRVKTKIDY